MVDAASRALSLSALLLPSSVIVLQDIQTWADPPRPTRRDGPGGSWAVG